jgi:Tfp pilus assembly protein PilX
MSDMGNNHHNRGVVLIMAVFIVALLAAIVTGMLQINTEEIQIMQNHLRAAEALAIAEAGLNDALAQLRADATWDAGFADKAFAGGAYTVTREGSRITSVGTSAQGFSAGIRADVTVAQEGPPHPVAIDCIRGSE